MKLYLARHGETEWNLQRMLQGSSDIPLNDTGLEQARQLREKIRGLDFDLCYASPLSRARQTAEIAVEGRCEIIIDELLTERDFGKLEGTNPENLFLGSDWHTLKEAGLLTPDENGVESIHHLMLRAQKFLEKVLAENEEDSKLLIVAHNGILRALHWQIVGYDETTDLASFWLKNGELSEHEILKEI